MSHHTTTALALAGSAAMVAVPRGAARPEGVEVDGPDDWTSVDPPWGGRRSPRTPVLPLSAAAAGAGRWRLQLDSATARA